MASSDQPRGYRFGSFILDLEWGGLFGADGKELPLRPKSFALLSLLAENAGRVVFRETILTALWPNLFVTENNVTQCIHDIRRVLGSEATRTLQTLPRRGYRFAPDVVVLGTDHPPTWRAGPNAPADDHSVLLQQPEPVGAGEAEPPAGRGTPTMEATPADPDLWPGSRNSIARIAGDSGDPPARHDILATFDQTRPHHAGIPGVVEPCRHEVDEHAARHGNVLTRGWAPPLAADFHPTIVTAATGENITHRMARALLIKIIEGAARQIS